MRFPFNEPLCNDPALLNLPLRPSRWCVDDPPRICGGNGGQWHPTLYEVADKCRTDAEGACKFTSSHLPLLNASNLCNAPRERERLANCYLERFLEVFLFFPAG